MKTIKELKEKGLLIDVQGQVLTEQIEMNGSLNDYNFEALLDPDHISGLTNLILDSPFGQVVVLSLITSNGCLLPFCDFPLALDRTELSLDYQIRSMYRFMAQKHLLELSKRIDNIPRSEYEIVDIILERSSSAGIIKVRKNKRKKINIQAYWQEYIGRFLKDEDVDYPLLAKQLFTFKLDLGEAIQGGNFLVYPLPTFTNLSNMLAMMHERYTKKKDKREYQVRFQNSDEKGNVCLPNLEETIFLVYSNLAQLARRREQSSVLIPFNY